MFGHRHTWSKWEQSVTTVDRMRSSISVEPLIIDNEVSTKDVDVQERVCKTCGYLQREQL